VLFTAEIKALAEVVVERDILVVSDEIYEKILYDGAEHLSIGSLGAEIFERDYQQWVCQSLLDDRLATGLPGGWLPTKAVSTIQGIAPRMYVPLPNTCDRR